LESNTGGADMYDLIWVKSSILRLLGNEFEKAAQEIRKEYNNLKMKHAVEQMLQWPLKVEGNDDSVNLISHSWRTMYEEAQKIKSRLNSSDRINRKITKKESVVNVENNYTTTKWKHHKILKRKIL
jgi:hypothetical protein